MCPWYIGKQPNSTYTCCDLNQINTLKSYTVKYVKPLLNRCPACFQNFMNVFCTITCDPSNSLFMDVREVINITTPAIIAVDVYFTNYYADKFYNSCKGISVQDTHGCYKVVPTLMCDSNVNCTAQKWLEFMGTPQLAVPTPFELNFVLTSNSSGSNLPTNISAHNDTLL